MKYAALFPGQGAQYAGMTKVLRDDFSWTKQFFEEASDSIKEDLYKMCLDGPEDALQRTHNSQPCILTTSYAWFQVLKRNLDFAPAAGAGHSLGEYTALCASGALTLTEAVRLVRKRGELMQEAVPHGKGKMAAVLGLDDDKVIDLCKRATAGDHSQVVPANFNQPGQVVIAGHAEAVDRAEAIATDGKVPELKARKVIPLKVSAPFHCPLMKPAADGFLPFLKATAWSKIRTFPVVNNVDAKLRSEGDLSELLRDQIDHPVQWTACMKTLDESGLTRFIEMGPGKVLTGLGKRILANAQFMGIETTEDVAKLETLFKEGK